MSEFWRDNGMDKIIETIIYIFNLEGVELVRMSGLTKHLNKIKSISTNDIELIISKLNNQEIIKYEYIYICPHCNEKSYIIIPKEDNHVKICDTCKGIYMLENLKTLFYTKGGIING